MKVVILAAGIGVRLGRPHPKALTVLANGKTILDEQIAGLTRHVARNDICVVVGFKKDLIVDKYPGLTYVINENFEKTNTSQSLRLGLREMKDCDVVWLNGDVVFASEVIARLAPFPGSCMAVNTSSVGQEEVKYRTDGTGAIVRVSKEVSGARGEAVGINKVVAGDVPLLLDCLAACEKFDFFERALEFAIPRGLKLFPVDISDLFCFEIDSEADLAVVNARIKNDSRSLA